MLIVSLTVCSSCYNYLYYYIIWYLVKVLKDGTLQLAWKIWNRLEYKKVCHHWPLIDSVFTF